ncbi:MAG: hypothetical protein ACNA8L_10280 [Luteolibacter sp.]
MQWESGPTAVVDDGDDFTAGFDFSSFNLGTFDVVMDFSSVSLSYTDLDAGTKVFNGFTYPGSSLRIGSVIPVPMEYEWRGRRDDYTLEILGPTGWEAVDFSEDGNVSGSGSFWFAVFMDPPITSFQFVRDPQYSRTGVVGISGGQTFWERTGTNLALDADVVFRTGIYLPSWGYGFRLMDGATMIKLWMINPVEFSGVANVLGWRADMSVYPQAGEVVDIDFTVPSGPPAVATQFPNSARSIRLIPDGDGSYQVITPAGFNVTTITP